MVFLYLSYPIVPVFNVRPFLCRVCGLGASFATIEKYRLIVEKTREGGRH